jgi:hypothetical protein
MRGCVGVSCLGRGLPPLRLLLCLALIGRFGWFLLLFHCFRYTSFVSCCFPCAGDPHCAVRCVRIVVIAACLCLVQCFAIYALPCEPGVIHPSIMQMLNTCLTSSLPH